MKAKTIYLLIPVFLIGLMNITGCGSGSSTIGPGESEVSTNGGGFSMYVQGFQSGDYVIRGDFFKGTGIGETVWDTREAGEFETYVPHIGYHAIAYTDTSIIYEGLTLNEVELCYFEHIWGLGMYNRFSAYPGDSIYADVEQRTCNYEDLVDWRLYVSDSTMTTMGDYEGEPTMYVRFPLLYYVGGYYISAKMMSIPEQDLRIMAFDQGAEVYWRVFVKSNCCLTELHHLVYWYEDGFGEKHYIYEYSINVDGSIEQGEDNRDAILNPGT